jgi:DNA-binding response OmpR family regulator
MPLQKAVPRLRKSIAEHGYAVNSVYGGGYCFEKN